MGIQVSLQRRFFLLKGSRVVRCNAVLKRIFDIVCAAVGLVLLLPIILLISVVILVADGRPIFFRQVRAGRHGAPFEMLKFRTMRDLRDANGKLLPDAERISNLGRFLRSTSLDELPELWNVLLGDMSIVGPRPLLMEYLDLYTLTQSRRHEVRPGLTGLAQVSGRNAISWEERLALDVWYVDNRTFLLDISIILKTLWSVIRREGVSSPDHATMPRFTGTGDRNANENKREIGE